MAHHLPPRQCDIRRTFHRAILTVAALCAFAVSARAQTVEYYHHDALGSVRAVTDQSGAVVERHDYLPFGEELNPPSGAQPRHFTGKERDQETGLDYFGARYYSAETARFTTIDPIFTWKENLVDPQRWNRYAYVRNNPLRYTDPDGRAIETGWDLLNVSFGVASLAGNLAQGNWGSASLDLAGLVVDLGATAVPGLPGGAGSAIRAGRLANKTQNMVAGPISMDEAVELGAKHVGGKGVMETTGKGTNFQFRDTTTTAEGTVTKISRFDVNPADKHVRQSGPHLNRETQVNGKTVTNVHTPVKSATVRKGDHP